MTREETKERIAVMQAYVDGKQIQLQLPDGKWASIPNPDWCNNANYRIKPGPKYRPFKDADECWQEMLKHQPFGWVKGKAESSYENLACITESSEPPIGFAGYSSEDKGGIVVRPGHSLDRMFEYFTFADGTPFGVKEG